MKCKDACDKISPWIDGELSLEIDEEISRHVSTCKSCQRQTRQLKELSTVLGQLSPHLAAPDLKTKTLERFDRLVAQGSTEKWFSQYDWFVRTAMAMGMAAGLYTGVRLGLSIASGSNSAEGFVSSVLYFSGGLLLSWV